MTVTLSHKLADLGHTMGDKDDGDARSLEPCDLSAQPFNVGNGQGRGRLVEQQHARSPCHCFRDLELLPSRQIKFRNERIRINVRDFECGELLRHKRATRPSIDQQPEPRRLVGQQHILRNGQILEKGQLLKGSLNSCGVRSFRRTETELDIPDTDFSGVRSNKST